MKLSPTTQLPQNYKVFWHLDMRRRPGLLLTLNLLGIILLLGAIWLTISWLLWLRPADLWAALDAQYLRFSGWGWFGLVLGVFAGMLLIHEGIHGLFFWIFTGKPPRFGVGPGYFYACAPDWYIPKRQAMVVMLAPAVGITLFGLLGLALLPVKWLPALILMVSLNLSGAVADLYVAARSIRLAPESLYHDTGHVMEVFGLQQGETVGKESRDPEFSDSEH